MPHDGTGLPVKAGDRVIMRFEVRDVSTGERDCNCTLQAVDFAGSGQTHLPIVACNTRLVELCNAPDLPPYEG